MNRSDPPGARVFFALEPAADIRRALIVRQRELGWSGRAVSPSGFHLTLAFLGQVPDGRMEDLRRVARSADLPGVTLALDRAGAFPRAGIGWVGPSRTPSSLRHFQADLVTGLAGLGFEPDRRAWSPHVTLYRKLRTRPATIPIDPVHWPIREFTLMASLLSPAGARYEVLNRWPVRAISDHRNGS